MSPRLLTLAVAPALALTALATGAPAPAAAAPPPVELQLLALNDFHGQLEPPSGSGARLPGFAAELGGSEYLATQVRRLEQDSKRKGTLTVAAGDLIGATPLLSAAFRDEPAIEALDALGLDYASVGNHEFDEGADELLRIQEGGCHPQDGCYDPELPYDGADFQYLSANAFRTSTGAPLLAPYAVHRVQGVDVGFIGMTLEGTPGVVTASGVAGLTFGDEADTANRYAAELQAQGVEAIVVLLHEGGRQAVAGGVDDCNGGLTGPITDIVPRMSDAIDVVITGHTHQAYTCELDGRLVTSASSAGRLVTDIDLTLDRRTGDVLTATADNVGVERTVAADPAQTALIARYRELLGPVAGRVVGTTPTGLTRTADSTGETPLGLVIADAQLEATRAAGAQAAFMNPGGVRADLAPGDVTFEEAFAVQPFGNFLATVTLTGTQLQCLLEQQAVLGRRLQPAGVTWAVSASGRPGTVAAPCTGTVVPDDSVRVAGQPVTPDGSYRITVNNFLADGGDGFSVLRSGTARTDGGDDLAALVGYLEARSPVSAPVGDRVVPVP